MFGIECTQDPDLTIPASPAPVATWSLNGMRLVDANANFELSDDTTFGGLGENGRLSTLKQINVTSQSVYTGEYMCNLTSIHGQDSASTIVG